MKKYRKIITPFLMGQWRDGLCRVRDIDYNPWEVLEVPECREVILPNSDEKIQRMAKIYFLLSEKIKEMVNDDFIPVSIAGDCVSTLGVLAGLQKAGKQPERILWLDAHGDFHTWETTQTKYIGGMPLAMLVGRGDQRIVEMAGLKPYPEGQIVLADGRDLDPGEKEALQNSKVTRCRIADISKHLPRQDESIYFHWDTDVVDAEKEMPALKYHVKSGPSFSDMKALFESLANRNIVAISVSAWHEEKDLHNKTATASLSLLNDLGVNISFT
ncbi:MAG: arginase family protein [Candidatus Kerfeldbacteria bacterium]|nr:arginase family protein [Candidatus Kerfeldbacteria bacterium]